MSEQRLDSIPHVADTFHLAFFHLCSPFLSQGLLHMTQSLFATGKMETLKSSLCLQFCSGRTFSKGSSSPRAARTKDYQLRRFKQQNLLIWHVRLQKPMIKVLTELGPGKTSLLIPQTGGCLGIRLCVRRLLGKGGACL